MQQKQETLVIAGYSRTLKIGTEPQLLSDLSKEVEKQLSVSIEKFQNMEATALLYKPDEQSWSVAECLWHLNSYGHFYLPEIRRALNDSIGTRPFKSGWLGTYFVTMMRPGAGKRKMKAHKRHQPPAELDPIQVVAEFIDQLEGLLDCLKKARNVDLNTRLPISISPFVKLKLGDVLRFLIVHNDRHIQQALRILD